MNAARSIRIWLAVARLYLHPLSTRRRIRELNKLAAQLLLTNGRLSRANRQLTRSLSRNQLAVNQAAKLLNEATNEITKLSNALRLANGTNERRTAERDTARARVAELEEQLARADADHAEMSGRLQDAEQAVRRYNEHLDRCEVADALDAEDTFKRVIDQ